VLPRPAATFANRLACATRNSSMNLFLDDVDLVVVQLAARLVSVQLLKLSVRM